MVVFITDKEDISFQLLFEPVQFQVTVTQRLLADCSTLWVHAELRCPIDVCSWIPQPRTTEDIFNWYAEFT